MNGAKYPREFERITKDGGLRRLRVPGGWLIHSSCQYIYHDKCGACSESIVYYPDPHFDWTLESE